MHRDQPQRECSSRERNSLRDNTSNGPTKNSAPLAPHTGLSDKLLKWLDSEDECDNAVRRELGGTHADEQKHTSVPSMFIAEFVVIVGR